MQARVVRAPISLSILDCHPQNGQIKTSIFLVRFAPTTSGMTPTAKCVIIAQMPHLGAADATESLDSVSSAKITSISTKRVGKLHVFTATPIRLTVSDATQVAALAVLHATLEWATFANTFGLGTADCNYFSNFYLFNK